MPSSRNATRHPSAKTSKTYSSLRRKSRVRSAPESSSRRLRATSSSKMASSRPISSWKPSFPRESSPDRARRRTAISSGWSSKPSWVPLAVHREWCELVAEREEAAQAGISARPRLGGPLPPAPDMKDIDAVIAVQERIDGPPEVRLGGGDRRLQALCIALAEREECVDRERALGHEDLFGADSAERRRDQCGFADRANDLRVGRAEVHRVQRVSPLLATNNRSDSQQHTPVKAVAAIPLANVDSAR